MGKELASTNVSFDFLKGSSEFLNLVLNNISSCVLLLNRDMELQEFNNAMKTIFTARKDEYLLYVRCGEAIGCAYQVEEMKDCGTTSHCSFCELRLAALTSYSEDKVVFKESIIKPFLNGEGEKVDKHLQFSTRLFRFKGERYILMIIDDITHLSTLNQ
ncbi:MAG: hypothetical protein JXA77_09110 [Bacteroidales bacterium]|nr:hypothetical protein [Bacteroidales bacterium]MBN2819600.1 hypothetical protein [Bacteroidales bacterium]